MTNPSTHTQKEENKKKEILNFRTEPRLETSNRKKSPDVGPEDLRRSVSFGHLDLRGGGMVIDLLTGYSVFDWA